MNLKHLSRLSLISAATTGGLCVFGLAYLTFSEKETPSTVVPALVEQPVLSIDPAPVEKSPVTLPVVDEIAAEPFAEPTSNVPNSDTDLDLGDAIAVFASAIAEDNTSLTTKELVHLDALFENLAHQQAEETSN